MQRTVFYSWQSDLPNSTNRGLISSALEECAKNLEKKTGEPVIYIDRDTRGVAGSPDIAQTIFDKIASADLFVADVTIVGKIDRPRPKSTGTVGSKRRKRRPTPNPNVLIELGFAISRLGHKRIILVKNETYGTPDELPFDLLKKRLTSYSLAPDAENKATARHDLSKRLEAQILEMLEELNTTHAERQEPEAPPIDQLLNSIRSRDAERVLLMRDYWDQFLKDARALIPSLETGRQVTHEEAWAALEATQSMVSLPGLN